MRRVLVTGASGFIGHAVCRRLVARGHFVRAAVRRDVTTPAQELVVVGDLESSIDWGRALDGIEFVVHLAARAHVLRETATDPAREYQRINHEATVTLARAATAHGVRRLVFASTIGVNGAGSNTAYNERDPARPHDPYSASKWESEQALRQMPLDVVILRPPLVFGPRVRGNFLELLRWTQRALPLPLGATHNRRSLVYVDDLAGLVELCLVHPAAANQTFVVSDPEQLSTTELIRRLARAMGRPSRLVPIPELPLRLLARLVGRERTITRLFGSLVVDASEVSRRLGWSCDVGLDEGLARTVAWYLGTGA